MASLNLDVDYFDHPKTKRLIGLLGNGSAVLPIKLWAYCGKVHAETGRLTGYSAQEIESLVDWWGKPGEFIAAMLRVGFLDKHSEDDYSVHDWLEHESHIAAFKIRARKGAMARAAKIAGEDVSFASSNLQACLKDNPNQPTNQHNQPTTKPADEVEAEKLSDAMGFARCWISAECQSKLKSACIRSFARLILRVGKDEAKRLALPHLADPGIGNPWAYVEGILDNEKLSKDLKTKAHPQVTGAKQFR